MKQKHEKRTLRIDNQLYRWTVHGDSGFIILHVWQEKSGQKLQVIFDYASEIKINAKTNSWSLRQRRSITPGIVRQVIEAALQRGWNSSLQASGIVRFQCEELGFPHATDSIPPIDPMQSIQK